MLMYSRSRGGWHLDVYLEMHGAAGVWHAAHLRQMEGAQSRLEVKFEEKRMGDPNITHHNAILSQHPPTKTHFL